MPITQEELERRFHFHPAKADQTERYERLRAKMLECAELVVELTPESREQSEAITCLETAGMFANAAIARRES